MDPLRIYDYLIKSRERVLDALRRLTREQYESRFAFGLNTIASTLTHIMISEWYYIERLEGRPVPAYAQWPIQYEKPPAFDVVERTWREQMKSIRAAIAAQRDWNRKITYVSFPDDDGKRFHITASAGDILTQLALHEVHHRAQIMAMLREMGDARPGPLLEDLDYNTLMYDRRAMS